MTLKAETLRALAEKATPGPWRTQHPSLYPEDNGLCIIGLRVNDDGTPIETPTNGLVAVATQSPVEADEGDFVRATANAELVTYLRNAAPEILALLEADKDERVAALEAEKGRMREVLDMVVEHFDGKRPAKLWMETERILRALGKDQAS